ncbi:DUF4352 domain-containing protein [Georgenia subflava]|uniref:DUF4352 domain-containing protein n=1 Tax=Georgenia subflava TaxID=1622177 RepID=A0A6N7EI87_9MICO|nr:DUF4352 domain-containing protein [Georgenia subflava]MPV37849.1 DUF4352 domain-containing protein [Georgenia subflava]
MSTNQPYPPIGGQPATVQSPVPPGAPGYASPGAPGPSYGFPGPPEPPAPAPEKRKSWFARHKILTIVLVIVALVALGQAVGNGGEEPDAVPSAAAPAAPADSDATAPGDVEPADPGDGDGAPADEAAAETEVSAPDATAAGVGTPVRDGKFEFTVTGIEPGVATVGNEFLNEQAQGQFVLVHLTVANIGDEAQAFYDGNQTLVDTAGREHSANTAAGIYLEDNDMFFNDINPGNSVSGAVVFDIPVDAVPASITLHDSMFSGGVTVSLTQ